MSQNVLITGGTGLVGQRLTQLLLQEGYQVSYLSRSKEPINGVHVYAWDIENGSIENGAVEKADYIIHLAGAGVADKRWTSSRKREILESRTKSADLLYKTLQRGSHQVKSVIAASAIGYYGYDTGNALITEDSPAGDDFLADVCQQWEFSVGQIRQLGIRTVSFRIGIVLSPQGGALAKLLQTIKVGAGAAIGSGKQYFSWVHIEDVCRAFMKAMTDDTMEGIYNLTAPNPVTNEQLTKQTADVLEKPLLLPNVPGFALKLGMGEMANAVLGGSNVSSQRLQATGYHFLFPELKPALEDLLIE
ncbi:TIGR01777 family oxidoreductase [Rhodocytophaga aerolata]|uniref:TIGR01777 family oxidoreductase n=1 Tax=Rhodocytophaga aerolata TaxID=455078 RepID=A0ABT8RAG2_9BACT|nr:TIGR01777 family oxidoreductase [Rhodocytophaga aerolata]MDO1449086.1 TIGR01777 family oxidoreductase [Rhodocytophaga aerolata]